MALNVRLFKLESSELKAKDFNYEISVNKARTKNWLIALSNSQVVSWIYQERGINFENLGEMVGELKQQGKYEEAEDLLFMDELLQIDFGSRSDLDVLMKKHNGLVTVNGKQYKYLVSKGSSTLTYIREDLYDMVSTRLNAGRNISKKLQPAKLSAYKSLAFTNSTPVTAPRNVIVIPDCEVQFQADYLWVGKDVDTIEHRNEVVTRDICDGCSFISPELAEQWSKDLGKDKILSAYQVRNLWTKGILFPVDYKKYCIEHEVYTIKDVWGTERNILMADLILTESMLKLNKGAYESMEDWLQACDDYGYVWRVAKTAKEDKWGNSNYQQFLPMELTEEDCREFVQDQVKFLKDVSGQNYESTYLFLNGVNNTERSIERLFNSDDVDYTLATALMIEPELINDKFLITKVGRNLRGMRNDMKLGRCMLDSNYQIIVCDPIQLLQHLIGIENPKGTLKAGELYSKKHMDKGIKEVLAFRAPMLIANNIVKCSIANIDEKYTEYFRYLDDVYCVNGNDLVNESLCGFDLDGDTLQLSDNKVFMRAYERKQELDLLPVKCDGIKADAVVIADDEQLIQTARIMLGRSVPSIGSVINTFSNVYAVRGQFSKDSKEYEVLTKRLLCGQAISQATIDAKKAGKYFEIPKHWENAKHIEFLPQEEQEFNAQLVADKQPYFFMYNYDKTKSKYNEWKEAVNVRCIAHWHTTYDKLVNTPVEQLTEEQRVFIAFAKEQCPINAYDNSTMYTFSKVAEEELEKTRLSTNKTDCRHLLKFDGVTYDEDTYEQAKVLYDVYKHDRVEAVNKVYTEGCYDEEDEDKQRRAVKTARDFQREKFVSKFMKLCNNNEKLAVNLMVDMNYNDNTDVVITWEVFGDVIITNLLEKHDYMVNAVVADKDGQVSYKGKQYKTVKLDLRRVAE